jgi:hypothetical protein
VFWGLYPFSLRLDSEFLFPCLGSSGTIKVGDSRSNGGRGSGSNGGRGSGRNGGRGSGRNGGRGSGRNGGRGSGRNGGRVRESREQQQARRRSYHRKSEHKRKEKKRKESPLHEHYVTPMSFLEDAVQLSSADFNLTGSNKPFGKNREAYARKSYEEILLTINSKRKEFFKSNRRSMAFIIRGSAGVGKSTFLGYAISRYRKVMPNIVIFHAPKIAKVGYKIDVSAVAVSIWIQGKEKCRGKYSQLSPQVEEMMASISLIVMDGCSVPLKLDGFKGMIIVAASPSLYVKNIMDAIFDHVLLTMPVLEAEAAKRIAAIVGVKEQIVMENFLYMDGITRSMFEPGAAKKKIASAANVVSASGILQMVSMQSPTKQQDRDMGHSLVKWIVPKDEDGRFQYLKDPEFELVSRYAESVVAKKLAKEQALKLKQAMEEMSPLSGAEGYAGALFEAYAIRRFQAGGNFVARSLDGGESKTICIPRLNTEPVVVECNTLSEKNIPYSLVRVVDPDNAGKFLPRLLWPITTNFPTFDCFYFHTNGEVFNLQMTIAPIHVLKNSGAFNAIKFLDKMYGHNKPAKYMAVFVVPSKEAEIYGKQKFVGQVAEQAADFGPHFDQLVVGV